MMHEPAQNEVKFYTFNNLYFYVLGNLINCACLSNRLPCTNNLLLSRVITYSLESRPIKIYWPGIG